MAAPPPRVSIGLPVYNGEKYLAASVESVLAQTMPDFELVISDNASTDATEEICRSFSDRDARVRYARNERNVGGARNYNLVFSRAVAPYFTWHTHDDVITETYLARCLEPLDADPSVVMTYPRIVYIGATGTTIAEQRVDDLSITAEAGPERIRRLMELELASKDIFWAGAFGVCRRQAVANTQLLGGYNAADQVLVLQLLLQGKFVQVDGAVFYRRDHPEASMAANREPKDVLRWFDPDAEKRFVLPHWRLLVEHLRSVHRVGLKPADELRTYLYVSRRFRKEWRNFPGDAKVAARDLRDSWRSKIAVSRLR